MIHRARTSRKPSNSQRSGFTLIEVMIVVSIIALLAAIAVPGFRRARKRAVAASVLNDLRLVDAAVSQYAIENSKAPGDVVRAEDWQAYIKQGTTLAETGEDALGNEFGDQTVDESPIVPPLTYYELSDVADDDYWEPYNP